MSGDTIKVAICDDDKNVRELLEEYCRRLCADLGVPVQVKAFSDGAAFVEGYDAGADIMLVDVKMPLMDGIETASEIRERDASVCIVFVTEYERYAVAGYRVGAYRYLVKPVLYDAFVDELTGAFENVLQNKSNYLNVKTDQGFMRIKPRDILYIETRRNHRIAVHTKDKVVIAYTSMIEVEEELIGNDFPFFRCHRSCLVNFEHIVVLGATGVHMDDGSAIPVSKYRKKEFQEEFAAYAAKTALSPRSSS